MDDISIAKLPEKQRDVLRLVSEGYEAKEIARKLAISPYTVVERLRTARRTLEAPSSREAARRLVAYETNPPYNRIVNNPIGVVDPPIPPHSHNLSIKKDGLAGSENEYEANTALQFQESDAAASQPRASYLPLPFPTVGRPVNDLTIVQTLFAILALALGLGLVSIAALAIVGEISRLILD
jgi:DNA-binding CsgD family transcriptional regulator